ncbi:MAG: isochorismatase family cysteine hydrolase, partial [Candidatus Aenigmarchaeota archaeon]|nr:isochorismatase family cysteine hydrolase [Candidatus Aenigmarchaeota archaeon]
ARKAEVKIIYTQDWHNQDDPEFKIWPRHCVAYTEGAEIVKELSPQEGDLIIKKSTYSTFYKTDLEERLKELEIGTLILMGCVTNVCVFFTAFDAYKRGYEIIAKKDCLGYVDERYHEFALTTMEKVLGVKIE